MPDRPDRYVISDLRQLKAIADPLRQRILGAFVAEPRTTKQVADRLGQPPTKLYHHVAILEQVGLITLVETRPKRGTTEKYYQAVASRFSVAESNLGGAGSSVVEQTFLEATEEVRREIRKAADPDCAAMENRLLLALGSLNLSPEDLPELERRISEIGHDLGKDRKTRQPYRYLSAIYPARKE